MVPVGSGISYLPIDASSFWIIHTSPGLRGKLLMSSSNDGESAKASLTMFSEMFRVSLLVLMIKI